MPPPCDSSQLHTVSESNPPHPPHRQPQCHPPINQICFQSTRAVSLPAHIYFILSLFTAQKKIIICLETLLNQEFAWEQRQIQGNLNLCTSEASSYFKAFYLYLFLPLSNSYTLSLSYSTSSPYLILFLLSPSFIFPLSVLRTASLFSSLRSPLLVQSLHNTHQLFIAGLSVSQAKPIIDGVIANGLLLYLPPVSLHSGNEHPRENEEGEQG